MTGLPLDTLADYTTATIPAGTKYITTAGCYEVGDKGQGLWKVLDTAPSPVRLYHRVSANGVYIKYAPQGPVYPLAMGAKNDLSIDSQPYIQDALELAAGSPIYCPRGPYRMDRPTVYDDGPWSIYGDGTGFGVTRVHLSEPPYGELSPVASGNCTQFVANFSDGAVFSSSSRHPVIMRDFQIDTAPEYVATRSGPGIFLGGDTTAFLKFKGASRITNVALMNQFDGIECRSPYMPSISECVFGGWKHAGVYMRTIPDIEGAFGNISKCDFWGDSGSTTQLGCVVTETGYGEVSQSLLLGAAYGVFARIKNGAAGAPRVKSNWIENQGKCGIYLGSGGGNAQQAAMFDFSGNEFSNLAFIDSFTASIFIDNYPDADADRIFDGLIHHNIHRHNASDNKRFIWVQAGRHISIHSELFENVGVGAITFGIEVGGVASKVEILDCKSTGPFTARYVTNANVSIRDLSGVPFSTLPTCANGSRIWVPDGLAGSNPGAGGGSGAWFERVGGAWRAA